MRLKFLPVYTALVTVHLPIAIAAATPLPRYQGDIGLVELQGCREMGGGVTCTVWVTTARKYSWWFSRSNNLFDENGKPIPAREVDIAGTSQSIADLHVVGKGVDIELGIRTRIVFYFDGANLETIRGLSITLGRWNNTYTFPYIPKIS